MIQSKKWLTIFIALGVPGLLVASTQAGQAAVLGKTTIGASNGGGLVANAKRVNEYQLNVPASVSKLDIYLSPSGTAGSQAMEGVIYADAGGSPGALVAQSQKISFSSTSPAGWVDFPLASDVTLSPGNYWLGIYTGGTSAVASYRYDLGATTRARLANNQTYTQGGASNPFGAIAWSDKNLMSLYATYTSPSTWTIQPVPNPVGSNRQGSGVSCTSSTACTAVGSSTNSSGTGVTLAERWNGSSWSIQTTPNPTGATSSSLNGVSCTSSIACTAVGSYTNSSGTSVRLAERWNGSSWSIQTTPRPAGATSSSLNGVSCTSATACTAVGSYQDSSANEATLAERWNGSSWSLQNTPNPTLNPTGANYSTLSSVSCASSTACTAVGWSVTGFAHVTLAERWNGTNWAIQTTPNPAVDYSSLSAVSCTSSTACIATGDAATDFGPTLTLAERWNGSSWSLQNTPNPTGATDSSLSGVSCTSSTACTAVGDSAGMTLAERWNGTSWSIQTTPNPTGATSSTLSSVSCASLGGCTAVGSSANSSGASVMLAERWNGGG